MYIPGAGVDTVGTVGAVVWETVGAWVGNVVVA